MRFKTAFRHELKYLITHTQRAALLEQLVKYTTPDQYGVAAGAYTIASLYYDTADYKAYWDKLEGHRNRRKVRVRVYGDQAITSDTPSFVEIKQRRHKLMCKKRVALPYATAIDLAGYPTILADFPPEEQAILQEIAYLQATLQLQPTCVVTYQRLALNGMEPYGDLRVTFDTHLRGRIHDLSLLSPGTTAGQLFVPLHLCVMEVKVNQRVPHWLATLLSQQRCTARRISKYCAALEQSGAIAGRQRLLTALPANRS